jgi:hypothetical protein
LKIAVVHSIHNPRQIILPIGTMLIAHGVPKSFYCGVMIINHPFIGTYIY